MIKLNIKNDPEQVNSFVALMKIMGKDGAEGLAAREAIAKLFGPTVTQVLNQAATYKPFFGQYSYNFGGVPELPIDAFDRNTEGLIDVWSSSIPGSLATNHISGGDVFRMTTFPYDTAISLLKRDAENGRFEILTKGIERAVQEVLVKTQFQAWQTILRALGGARANGAAQLVSSTTTNVLQPADFEKLQTKVKRFRTSWVGGTPTNAPGRGITHYVLSPEMISQVRSWGYEPVNTRPGSITTSGATAVPLPDQIRMSIWNNSGLPEIPGIGKFVELLEFGVGQAYNSVFDSGYTEGVGDPTFNSATDELVLGVDLSVEAAVQLTASDSDRTSELEFKMDDQFSARSGRIGWYAELETGFGVVDTKAYAGIIV